jgi:hypothetical protein
MLLLKYYYILIVVIVLHFIMAILYFLKLLYSPYWAIMKSGALSNNPPPFLDE